MAKDEKDGKSTPPPGFEPDAPPSYDEQEEQAQAQKLPQIPPLDLSDPGPPTESTVAKDQCIAHLKLLAAFADLRDAVSCDDGLFGIYDAQADKFASQQDRFRALARIREKRWAVYTARAVDRFTSWWSTCVPTWGDPPTLLDLTDPKYLDITNPGDRIVWTRDKMPPLDVVMVWHAYMLNPRSFLEDCIRNAKMTFWAAGLPWDVLDQCIDNQSFEYRPGDAAKTSFETRVGRSWDNLDDLPEKLLDCPRCQKSFTVPWTSGEMSSDLDKAFESATGYADKNLQCSCPHCSYFVDHQRLRVAKFRKDLEALIQADRPMPGTLYNVKGIPESSTAKRHPQTFPNRLLKAASQRLLRSTDPRLEETSSVKDMQSLRRDLGELFKDKKVMTEANWVANILLWDERIAFRRMMSRYWENSSPFALDLVGAVIRQGTFVQKMDNLDWIHSPALSATMERLIRKYGVFFEIMSRYPDKMAVPTLDVDLAWHTHQLSPARYFEFSKQQTKGTFIDHDDKVEENKLSEGFEWTSKIYKKLTDGGIYSECTCWYCEAVREPILYSGGLFRSGSTARARSAAENLHHDPNISSDPEKNPHISAHNAVRAKGDPLSLSAARVREMQLRNNYEKARRRAEKRRSKNSKNKDSGDALSYAPMVWGVPLAVGFYAPYMSDPGVNADAYACNPACMNGGLHAYGNCAASTCAAAVAAAGCGTAAGCSGLVLGAWKVDNVGLGAGNAGNCGIGGFFGACGGGGGGGGGGCGGGGFGGGGGC
ncbi:hypothetical protein VTN96DRAFT_10378 [Rasamsonia emersonii]